MKSKKCFVYYIRRGRRTPGEGEVGGDAMNNEGSTPTNSSEASTSGLLGDDISHHTQMSSHQPPSYHHTPTSNHHQLPTSPPTSSVINHQQAANHLQAKNHQQQPSVYGTSPGALSASSVDMVTSPDVS